MRITTQFVRYWASLCDGQTGRGELAKKLYEISGQALRNQARDNAKKLKRVVNESFPLDAALAMPVQRVLDLTLDHIHYLEDQIAKSLS